MPSFAGIPSGDAEPRINAIRGLAWAARGPSQEGRRASEGAGSHEPEEHRGAETRSDKP